MTDDQERIKHLQDIIKEDTAEILRLRAENEKLRAENETHKEIAVRETMKNATLRAVLKPFAKEAASFHENFGDGHLIRDDMDLTLGDLRAAAAALKDIDNRPEKMSERS